MTSLASLGDLGMGQTVGMVLCEGTPRVVPCTQLGDLGMRWASCVRGPLGESHDVPCIPRGHRDGTDSRDGAV